MTKPGLWQVCVKKAFQFNQGILHGNPDVITYTATPNAAVTAGKVGTLCYDTTGGDVYIKTADPSTWVKINA